ncbi:MAG: hypothetical protein CME19_23625 [Gemmatimonadetes bacterium]|nr:hypothetical protein [Gemmatimonadota bacterium]
MPSGRCVGCPTVGEATLLNLKRGVVVSKGGGGIPFGISEEHLTQLLFGYRSIEDLRIAGEARVAARWIPLIDALFLKSDPYMWWPDRFYPGA